MTAASVDKDGWVRCPVCGGKTRVKVSPATHFYDLPLYCPKCRKESIVSLARQKEKAG